MGGFQGMTVQWWESARREVRCMANLVCYMYCHVGSEWCLWLFATHAMGENEHDHGGFGICATELRPGELRRRVSRLPDLIQLEVPDTLKRCCNPQSLLSGCQIIFCKMIGGKLLR